MTSPLLNYQTPAPVPRSGLFTTAWIYVLVLGILYCLGGLCAGGSMAFVAWILSRGGGAAAVGFVMIFGGVLVTICVGCGAAYIWSALRLRRGSRAAAIVALTLAVCNAVVILVFLAFGIYVVASASSADLAPMSISLIMYFLIAIANIVAAYFLIRVLRLMRRDVPALNSM